MQDAKIHPAHLPPPCPGLLPGQDLAKAPCGQGQERVPGSRSAQNNQGQNRWHEAKSHRERLLRLSCMSDPHGRSGAGQHLASIPAAGTVPPSTHTPP